jgi:hypothetical protein
MADATVDTRGAREESAPSSLPKPSPLFTWPAKLMVVLKFVYGAEGFLWPKNALYFAVAALSWWLSTGFTGGLARASSLEAGWIAELYLHNAAMMLVFAGLPHLLLYIQRAQGRPFKYRPVGSVTLSGCSCSAIRRAWCGIVQAGSWLSLGMRGGRSGLPVRGFQAGL